MFGFIKTQPLLDESTTQWLFDAFAWSLRQFDSQVFYRETVLVTPSNRHFPGRESSAEGMAQLIFHQVKQYAGMSHWPLRLLNGTEVTVSAPAHVMIEGPVRGSKGLVAQPTDPAHQLVVPYNAQQLAKPEALIAQFAHILAHYLGQTSEHAPPGGEQFWPQATELLAIFMGFGLMIANSAYTFRGGCGSCYNPLAERSAYLSQDEATYALAIFSTLKAIPVKDVSAHLKPYLRPVFKRAAKEVEQDARLSALQRGDAFPPQLLDNELLDKR